MSMFQGIIMPDDEIYNPPLSEIEKTTTKPKRPWGYLLLTAMIVPVSGLLSFSIAYSKTHNLDYIHGYVLTQILVMPVVVALLFQIGSKFRNIRSIVKIFFWSSIIVFLSLLGNLSPAG